MKLDDEFIDVAIFLGHKAFDYEYFYNRTSKTVAAAAIYTTSLLECSEDKIPQPQVTEVIDTTAASIQELYQQLIWHIVDEWARENDATQSVIELDMLSDLEPPQTFPLPGHITAI